MASTLRLTEYQRSAAVRLEPELRDALIGAIPGITVAPASGERDTYELTPSSWVGVAALPGLLVEVKPKIPVDRLLFLLSYSLHKRGWKIQDAALDPSKGLLEAFVPIFCEVVRRAVHRDLLQGYRTEEDALQTVRGRIRFDDQIRDRFGIFPPIEVRYDDFTVDTNMNRLIKAAVHRLGRLTVRSAQARSELRRLAARFRPVTLAPFEARKLPEFFYDRLTDRYRPALELASLVLRATSVELRAGALAAPSLLVDMNQVFEDFVVTALREELSLGESRFPQNCRGQRMRLDTGGRVKLEPDLSWWEAGRCVFVGDAKYKRLETKGFKNGDLYQMLAYCTAADLPGGLLVYAAGEGDVGNYEIVHADKTIEVVHLNLDGTPETVLREIGALAERVRRWRQSSIRPAA